MRPEPESPGASALTKITRTTTATPRDLRANRRQVPRVRYKCINLNSARLQGGKTRFGRRPGYMSNLENRLNGLLRQPAELLRWSCRATVDPGRPRVVRHGGLEPNASGVPVFAAFSLNSERAGSTQTGGLLVPISSLVWG